MAVFGIFDVDKEFTLKLVNYINDNQTLSFDMMAFTEMELLTEYLQNNTLDVLLINNCFKKDFSDRCKKVIYLSEDVDDNNHIYKYQKVQQIVDLIKEYTRTPAHANENRNTLIYAVYSLDSVLDRSIFAMGLSYELADKGEVLYMNLDRFVHIGRLLGIDECSISDVIYRYLNGESIKDIFDEKLPVFNNTVVISSAVNPRDLEEVGINNLTELINEIVNLTQYRFIVLDIGNCFRQEYEIFKAATQAYIVTKDEDLFKEDIEAFKKYISTNFTKKISVVRMPYDNSFREDYKGLLKGESIVIKKYIKDKLYG